MPEAPFARGFRCKRNESPQGRDVACHVPQRFPETIITINVSFPTITQTNNRLIISPRFQACNIPPTGQGHGEPCPYRYCDNIMNNVCVPANKTKHHRRSIRLPEYDYSREGAYYVTICTSNHKYLFGEIINGEMVLNEWGKIAAAEIIKTETLRPGVIIDTYTIMPNHVHMIILICDDAAQGRDMACHVPMGRRPFGKPQPGSLSAIVGSIK